MSTYRIGTSTYSNDPEHAAALQRALLEAHRDKVRPLCRCTPAGVEMYVARVDAHYLIKRMPGTGPAHASSCDSYEPPAELSGLGQVMGSAIQEDLEGGTVALRLDFSLTKIGGRASPAPGDGEGSSVKADANKLTLRATLHYLWEQAGLNRWSPAMQGKRSWFVVRKYLLQAAQGKTAKGSSLADLLFIPETFHSERRGEISSLCDGMLARLAAPSNPSKNGARKLMLVIGQVKDLLPARFGHKIVFKHLPEHHFFMSDDLHKRLLKRFEMELALWGASEKAQLMAIATFSASIAGTATLEEVSLMTVTDQWLPFESPFDDQLIHAMAARGRRFVKGLRYNLSSDRPLASLVASDTAPKPTAMYILPPGASDAQEAALAQLMADSQLASWVWRVGAEMPALPDLPGAPARDAEAVR